ncbi:hypothetical protein [Microscilla marina]|uniref:STAS/SEC14 domain-containing protein n=1 Tax=Microscilla marina ATCC 23134 TaxID=313606 RepID=A1ZN53_MICM2|nr:hypothetical protein [Microscilla marina]EAY28234.1 hypothetical protein M23134_03495 [Microscilla marina ATCC 23134]
MAKITLSNNQYFESSFDQELKLYELIWHKASEAIEDDEYKALMNADRDKVLQECDKLNYIVINIKERMDTMSPELQEWSTAAISSQIFSKYNVLKIAVIASKDFYTQVSVEQAIEEDNINEGVVRYFEDEQQATEWILGL